MGRRANADPSEQLVLKVILPPNQGGYKSHSGAAAFAGAGPLEAGPAVPEGRGPIARQRWGAPGVGGSAEGSALDKIAKFAATSTTTAFQPKPDLTDRDLLIRGMTIDPSRQDEACRNFSRVERWALKAEAAKALGSKWDRVSRCHRYALVPKGSNIEEAEVDIWHSPSRRSASYGKVETCANVWCCPVCSAKISERRREELQLGVRHWKDRGGSIALLTVTFRHGAGDDLGVILDRFLDAYHKMTGWRAYRAWRDRAGLRGYVRALEVTHGAHGWHPHGHVLLFLEGTPDLAQLERELYPLWAKAVTRAGLPGTSPQAFKLHDGSRAAEYVSKFGRQWTEADELTKAMSKRGRNGNRTPWDLLRSALYHDDQAAPALFKVYAQAFKGKKQLTWSKGLRSLLGLDVEKDDQQLADERQAEDDQLLASLDLSTWRRVTWAKAQGQLLEVAATGSLDAVLDFVAALPPPGTRRREKPSEQTASHLPA